MWENVFSPPSTWPVWSVNIPLLPQGLCICFVYLECFLRAALWLSLPHHSGFSPRTGTKQFLKKKKMHMWTNDSSQVIMRPIGRTQGKVVSADTAMRKLHQGKLLMESVSLFSTLILVKPFLMFQFMLLCPHCLASWERIHPQLFSPDTWVHVVNSVGDGRKHQDGKYKEWLCQAICLAVLNKGREKGWLLDSGKYESSFWKQYFTTELVMLVTMVIVATLAAVNTNWELSLCQAQGWVCPMHLIYLQETQKTGTLIITILWLKIDTEAHKTSGTYPIPGN